MFEQLSTATTLGIDVVQKQIETKLKYALQERLRWALDIKIFGMTIVLPANSCDQESPVIVIDTGEYQPQKLSN